ncbi:hypothetical protein [Zymomonas mobilis]|nr:hypothetical protein [Zymomonas mobilis]
MACGLWLVACGLWLVACGLLHHGKMIDTSLSTTTVLAEISD